MTALRILFTSIDEARRQTPFFIEEENLGIWLSTRDTSLLAAYPTVKIVRDAVHIPSEDRHRVPLPQDLLDSFLARAVALGLTVHHPAHGYWTLSHSGMLQIEDVVIAASEHPVDRRGLLRLAGEILQEGGQDAVAYEIDGNVEVLRNADT